MSEEKPKDHSFLKHAAVYGIGTIVLQAASIVLLPLYTNYLTPAEYGVMEILNRIGDVLVICLMVNGIRMATLTFYRQAEDPQQRRRIAATVTLFLVLFLIGCELLVLVFAGHLSSFLGVDDPRLLAFGIFAVLLQATTVIPLVLMQARLESGFYVLATVGTFFCRVVLAVLAVAVLGWGIWGVLGATAASSLIFGVVLTVRELSRGSFRPDLAKLREVVRYALPFVPGGLCFFVLHNGDRFFLVKCVSDDELGLYALGYKLAAVVSTLSIVPLYKVWSARMYDAFKAPDAPAVVGRVFSGILGAYLFMGMGLCLFQHEVLAVLGSEAFAPATAFVRPLVLAYFFMAAADLMDAAFYVCRRTGRKPWIAAASTATMFALYAWLIPQYGAMGAALATLFGFLFHAAMTFAVSQRVFRVQYEPFRLAMMLSLAIVLTLASPLVGSGLAGFIGKSALWAAWPVVLWSWGIITEEEKQRTIDAAGNVFDRFRRLSRRGRMGAGSRQ